ncbi:mucin-2-like isoform X2 [Toxorhynchites rutilus septentrionalis]|uniref:mucin-2-like isoform X2 n=1 Tax=Toxorhynchites rutilus septentrionalis TaxID=329112 RepID=UPI00247852D3|nr:mucin-2-like isoform X2 [Toxorhynchites rutilus septentrionalis]
MITLFRILTFITIFLGITHSTLARHTYGNKKIEQQYYHLNPSGNTYYFGYHVGPKGHFHHERRGHDGVTYGCYGYIDSNKQLQVTHYVADRRGYRVVDPNKPVQIFVTNRIGDYSDELNDFDYGSEDDVRSEIRPWHELLLPKGCGQHTEETTTPGVEIVVLTTTAATSEVRETTLAPVTIPPLEDSSESAEEIATEIPIEKLPESITDTVELSLPTIATEPSLPLLTPTTTEVLLPSSTTAAEESLPPSTESSLPSFEITIEPTLPPLETTVEPQPQLPITVVPPLPPSPMTTTELPLPSSTAIAESSPEPLTSTIGPSLSVSTVAAYDEPTEIHIIYPTTTELYPVIFTSSFESMVEYSTAPAVEPMESQEVTTIGTVESIDTSTSLPPILFPSSTVSPSLAVSLNITIGESTEIPIESLVLEGDSVDTIPADFSSAEVDQDTAIIIEQQLQTQPQTIENPPISQQTKCATPAIYYFIPYPHRAPPGVPVLPCANCTSNAGYLLLSPVIYVPSEAAQQLGLVPKCGELPGNDNLIT